MARFIRDSATIGQPQSERPSYKLYLQQQEFVQDISGMINSQTSQYIRAIDLSTNKLSQEMSKNSKAQIAALAKSTECIVGALDKGFNQLSQKLDEGFREVNSNLVQIQGQLSDLNLNIQNLAGLIDIKFNALIEQQKITNIKLQQILEFAKVPEFQKERIYYLENGLKYLKNAQIDPRRYVDALECLKEAEKREKRDYITLYNIGIIHLFSSESVDINAAEDYFLRAADYADDEIPQEAVKSTNYIGEVKQNSTQFVKNIASNSFHFASYAQYLGDKFEDSIKNSLEALKINPNLKECRFNNALSYMALGKEDEAMENIKSLSNDHNYIIDAAFNPNIAVSEKAQEFFVNLRDSRKEQLLKKLSSVISIAKLGSPLYDKSNALFDQLDENTFLNVLTVSKKIM